MTLLNGIWLNETKAETPNWDRCLEVAELVGNLGAAHEAISLIAVAHWVKAAILEEYLHDPPGALKAIAEGEAKIGKKHRVLSDWTLAKTGS